MVEELSPEFVAKVYKQKHREVYKLMSLYQKEKGKCISCQQKCDNKGYFCLDTFYTVRDDTVDNGVTWISECLYDFLVLHKMEFLEIIVS